MSSYSLRERKLPPGFKDDEFLAVETPQKAPKSKKGKEKKTADIKPAESNEPAENKKPSESKKKPVDSEKRLRRFRPKAPISFEIIYQRATEQRFYVLNRSRGGTAECPEEDVEITGSTGNIYQVHIAQMPSCNCPHALNGNQCKHIIYVMCRVLRARHDLVYQLALLSSELREIFENAPPIPTEGDDSSAKPEDPNRKQIEGDCPICYTPFEAAEDTVYCRATCGQNMHKECFQIWATTKRESARGVTCPMCRSPWQEDEGDVVKNVKKNTGVTREDGYVNVAGQLGISGVRDTSTYYDGPGRHRNYSGYGYRQWR